jgi:guanyl-specific ribonuclease Sa
MAKWMRLAALLFLAVVAAEWWSARAPTVPAAAPAGARPAATEATPAARYPSFLPPEAVVTLELIERGGPFPYDRDGTTFQNRERLLPDRPRGYYREYTVETPGSRDRGARRIVTGGDPPEVYFYTDDHYRSFRRVEVGR